MKWSILALIFTLLTVPVIADPGRFLPDRCEFFGLECVHMNKEISGDNIFINVRLKNNLNSDVQVFQTTAVSDSNITYCFANLNGECDNNVWKAGGEKILKVHVRETLSRNSIKFLVTLRNTASGYKHEVTGNLIFSSRQKNPMLPFMLVIYICAMLFCLFSFSLFDNSFKHRVVHLLLLFTSYIIVAVLNFNLLLNEPIIFGYIFAMLLIALPILYFFALKRIDRNSLVKSYVFFLGIYVITMIAGLTYFGSI